MHSLFLSNRSINFGGSANDIGIFKYNERSWVDRGPNGQIEGAISVEDLVGMGELLGWAVLPQEEPILDQGDLL